MDNRLAFDHNALRRWTRAASGRFNGRMDIAINTTSVLAAATAPGAHAAASAGTACRCVRSAQEGRDLLDGLARTARSSQEAFAGAVRLCEGLDWTGPAAALFRERLSETARFTAQTADAAEYTARLAMIGGAP